MSKYIDNPRDLDKELIKPYDYDPIRWRYRWGKNEKKNHLLIGVELEIEMPESTRYDREMQEIVVESLRDLPQFIYIKRDGSLYFGVELVTHPLSWQWLQENKEKWSKVFELKEIGFNSFNTATCGMHIHLGRDNISRYTLYKMAKFIYNPSNYSFILSISGRSEADLSRWATVHITTKGIRNIEKELAYYLNYTLERHIALNVYRATTAELRIFKGTLVPSMFWKNIEFAHALYVYALTHKPDKMYTYDFLCWLYTQQKMYSHLFRFVFIDEFVLTPE